MAKICARRLTLVGTAPPAFYGRFFRRRRLVATTVRSPPPLASPRPRSYEAPVGATRLLGWARARPRCSLTTRPSPAPIRRRLGPPFDEEELATWSTRFAPLPVPRGDPDALRGHMRLTRAPPPLSLLPAAHQEGWNHRKVRRAVRSVAA